jgi:hypothetical protein
LASKALCAADFARNLRGASWLATDAVARLEAMNAQVARLPGSAPTPGPNGVASARSGAGGTERRARRPPRGERRPLAIK